MIGKSITMEVLQIVFIITLFLGIVKHCESFCTDYTDSFESASALTNNNAVWFNEETLLRESISTHLGRCLYLRLRGLDTDLLCRQSCAVTETCLAYRFSASGYDDNCDLCVTKSVRSVEVEHSLSEVNVDLMKGNFIKELICDNGIHLATLTVLASHDNEPFDGYHGLLYICLDTQEIGGHAGGYAADINVIDNWIRADFGTPKHVLESTTQGRNSQEHIQWVTLYTLSYGSDSSVLQYVLENGQVKEFEGNTDQDSKVTHQIFIYARYVQLTIKGYVSYPVFRWGLKGY